ncbi:hypothetical protein Tco_0349340 [Tanacetum coccineum]
MPATPSLRTRTEVPLQSSSVSSDFTTQFLNFNNVLPTDNEIISMMNVDVRHEEPSNQTPSLLTIPVMKSQSYQGAKEHKELYDGPVKYYKLDKDLFESYGKAYSLKRDSEDKDKDEDPPAGSDQGLKRRKTSQDYVQAEESVFEDVDTEMLLNQGSNLGNTVDFRPPQTWISKIAQAEKPPLSFDELMSTPIDFSAYVMNHLKIDNLTQDHHVGPVFNLLKRTCKIHVELEYNIEDFPVDYFINNDLKYLRGGSSSRKYTTSTTKTKAVKYDIQGIKDMGPKRQRFYGFASNMVSKYDVYSSNRIIGVSKVKVMKWYDYGYLEEIEVQREDQKLYKFKEGIALRMFTRRIIILKRVKDLQLGVKSYQKKLNITKPETFRSDISNRTPYTAYNNPQGIIFEDKYKINRLMRTDELFKFSDGTLTSVRSVLHDIASNLRMDYLPKRIWSSLDRKRSRIMIKAIDKQLLERRLIGSLEKLIGGRDYGEDLKLLQRTI